MTADDGALSRRERRKREVRERIMEAAMDRFVAQGFAATTVDQIAEDADVAQKTFFNYFPTKQDLFRQLAEERIDELQEILEEEREREGATAEKLVRSFLRLSELLEQRGRLGRDLVLEMMRARTLGDTGEDISRLHQAFGGILRDGQGSGDVRRDHPVQFLTEMVVGCFGGVMSNWLHLPDYPVKDRLAATAAFLGEAISPPDRRGRSA
ncbi:MAG: TetR/AcrR family transcriptional regulator [Myxococcota bacterium]